jgi:hypothetical protein
MASAVVRASEYARTATLLRQSPRRRIAVAMSPTRIRLRV